MASSTSYSSYIQLSSIVESQCPKSSKDNPIIWGTERFFIVCHQASELWVSQLLTDLELAVKILNDKPMRWRDARLFLTRAASTSFMLCQILEHLSYDCPKEHFMAFRELLQGMSGAESQQFHQVFRLVDGTHEHVIALRAALEEAKAGVFEQSDTSIPQDCDVTSSAMALEIMLAVCDIWRQFHMLVAKSFIREKGGTGGTTGSDFLHQRLLKTRLNVSNKLLNSKLSSHTYSEQHNQLEYPDYKAILKNTLMELREQLDSLYPH